MKYNERKKAQHRADFAKALTNVVPLPPQFVADLKNSFVERQLIVSDVPQVIRWTEVQNPNDFTPKKNGDTSLYGRKILAVT